MSVDMQQFQFQQQGQAEQVAPEQQSQHQGQLSWVQRQQNASQQQQNNTSESALDQSSSTAQNENDTSGVNGPVEETPTTEVEIDKLNGQFNNRHEPGMCTKMESSDRRRSQKDPGSTMGLAAGLAQQQVALQSAQLQQQHQRQHHGCSLAAQHASEEETTTTSPPFVHFGCPEVPWTSCPHLDLARELKQHGDTNLTYADIYISRIAYMASHEQSSRQKMIGDGVALTLTTLLCHPQATLAMRQNAVFAIAELAVSEEGEEALVKAGAIPLLVWLTDTNNHLDVPLLTSACRALRNLLSYNEPTAVLAARYGCVDPLLKLLVSDQTERCCVTDADVLVEAVAATSNLVQHGVKFQSYVLIKHGGLAALVELGCSTDNDQVLYHVINLMAECAKNSRWHKVIIDKGGLRVALRALQSAQSREASAEAARLIGNIAMTSKARVAARQKGSVTAIMDLLLQQYPTTANNTSNAQNSQGRQAAADSPSALPPAFKSPLLTFDLLRALSNMCADLHTASDILAHDDATRTLFAMYTADRASDVLVNASFHTLIVLAQGSATHRARVLYGIAVRLKHVTIMGGMSPKRLHDLRQAILEQVQSGY